MKKRCNQTIKKPLKNDKLDPSQAEITANRNEKVKKGTVRRNENKKRRRKGKCRRLQPKKPRFLG